MSVAAESAPVAMGLVSVDVACAQTGAASKTPRETSAKGTENKTGKLGCNF